MTDLATAYCSVKGCQNRTKPMHHFPNPRIQQERFKLWLTACQNSRFAKLTPQQIHRRGFVCHLHFAPDQLIPGTKKLLKIAVPTINVFRGDVPAEVEVELLEECEAEPAISNIGSIEIRQDETDFQLVDEAEVLNNLHLLDTRFIDVPETDTPCLSLPYLCDGSVKKDFNIGETIEKRCREKHIRGEVVSDTTTTTMKSQTEKIGNLEMNHSDQEEEVVFDSEPFVADVQENHESCNDPQTVSGEKESLEVAVTFTKPYFRSVKSYLKDCNRMTEVCRICFCSLDDNEVINLYKDTPEQDSAQIKNMLKLVLPDLDLEIYPNTVICTKCVELLLYSYQLREKWLLTEEKLHKIIEQKKDVISSVADLVIIGKLINKNTQNFEGVPGNDRVCTGQPDFQEGTQLHMTDEILENLLSHSNAKLAPTSVFYGQLVSNNKNAKHQEDQKSSEQKSNELNLNKKPCIGPFMCEQCGRMFMHFKSLKRHLISHTKPKEKKKNRRLMERKFMCEICGQLFISPSHLKTHTSKHAEYTCSICNRVFNHQFRLQNHIKWKHIRNCYQCHLCGKQVSYPRSLQLHIRLHYPKPKHQVCNICDKKFHYPSNLKKHLRSHVREKLLRCTYCDRFLKHEISLQKHIQIYHKNKGQNVCEFCDKPYWKKCDLEKHKIRCHGGSFATTKSNEQNSEVVTYNEEFFADNVYYYEEC